MKETVVLFWRAALAFGLPMKAYGQGTFLFNNLDESNGLVFISRGSGGLPVPLNRDLNFSVLAAPSRGPFQLIHTWLLSDGSAKGINVAPGRFADPSGQVFVVRGVPPGERAGIMIRAWPGDYNNYGEWQLAQSWGVAASGQGFAGVWATGIPGEPAPGLTQMMDLFVYPVPDPISPLMLGIGWSNGIPYVSVQGTIGNSYALEFTPALAATGNWQSLLNQTQWVLTNNPQYFLDSSAPGAGGAAVLSSQGLHGAATRIDLD